MYARFGLFVASLTVVGSVAAWLLAGSTPALLAAVVGGFIVRKISNAEDEAMESEIDAIELRLSRDQN